MTDVLKSVTDLYWLQARLYPALLTILPSLVVIVAFWPHPLSSTTGNTVLALAGAVGLLYAVAVVARSRGKKTERRLLKAWGGWPTTIWLRHRTGVLPPQTLERYHRYLAKNGIALPTAEDEARDPDNADRSYASAIEWLKEHTRAKSYRLVVKENAEYGFRRNLRGLRTIGVALCIVGIAACAIGIESQAGFSTSLSAFFERSHLVSIASNRKLLAALVFNVTCTGLWFALVRDSWVREGADQYSRALLATCEGDMGSPTRTTHLRRGKDS
jgi:hypothetical protein